MGFRDLQYFSLSRSLIVTVMFIYIINNIGTSFFLLFYGSYFLFVESDSMCSLDDCFFSDLNLGIIVGYHQV